MLSRIFHSLGRGDHSATATTRQLKPDVYRWFLQFRLLNIVHPDNGTHELLTKGAIDAVGALMVKNVGSVQAYNTRPLFEIDLEQVFEKSPPKTMSDLSCT